MKPGPKIGILVDKIRSKKALTHKITISSFKAYLEACNKIGASVCTFGLNDIDLINRRVYGYIPSIDSLGNMIWDEKWLPIPDLIVNRTYVYDSSIMYKKINKLISSFPNLKIINRVTRISKWEMYKSLQKNNKVNKYLPKTVLFEGIDSLDNMLKEFSCVYLKPTDGSLGMGVVKITKEKEKEYVAKYRIRKKNYSVSGSLSDVLLQLKSLMGKSIYIVQECIPLATYNGDIFDMRVCLQKDGAGKWSVPKWIVRIAKPDNVVTNNAAGAGSLEVEEVIGAIFPNNSNEILDKIKNTSLLISKTIEKNYSGIGDIGMDLAITNTGKIYFVEANLRQTKFIYGTSEEYLEWKTTFKLPICYLNYLYELETSSPKS